MSEVLILAKPLTTNVQRLKPGTAIFAADLAHTHDVEALRSRGFFATKITKSVQDDVVVETVVENAAVAAVVEPAPKKGKGA